MTLIVADDDPAVLRFVVRVLRARGWRAATATTGAGLLRKWRKLRCPVVLSDIGMPGSMDGIRACGVILSLDPNVRVFLMTGDPEAHRRAEAAGLKVAFSKPFLLKDLTRWMESLSVAL